MVDVRRDRGHPRNGRNRGVDMGRALTWGQWAGVAPALSDLSSVGEWDDDEAQAFYDAFLFDAGSR